MREWHGQATWQLEACPRCGTFHPRHCPDCWNGETPCADHICTWPEDEEEDEVTRYVITMPGRLYQGMVALGAIEDAAISQGAVNAFERANERRRGRGSTYEIVGTRSPLSEILEVLKELVLEMDGGVGPARDLGVESTQLRAAARQAMLPYTG